MKKFILSIIILTLIMPCAGYGDNSYFKKFRNEFEEVFLESYSNNMFSKIIMPQMQDAVEKEMKELVGKVLGDEIPDELYEPIKQFGVKYPLIFIKYMNDPDGAAADFSQETVGLLFNMVKPSVLLKGSASDFFLSSLDSAMLLPYTITLSALESSVVAMKDYKAKNVYWIYLNRRLSQPQKSAENIFKDLIRQPSFSEQWDGHASTFNTYYSQWVEFIDAYVKGTGKEFYKYPKDKIQEKKNQQFYTGLYNDLEAEVKYFQNILDQWQHQVKWKAAEGSKQVKFAMNQLREKIKAFDKEHLEYLSEHPILFDNLKRGILKLAFENDPKELSNAMQKINELYNYYKELDNFNFSPEFKEFQTNGYDLQDMEYKLNLLYTKCGGSGNIVTNVSPERVKLFQTWCNANIFNVYNSLKNGSLKIGPLWKLKTTFTIKTYITTPEVEYEEDENGVGRKLRDENPKFEIETFEEESIVQSDTNPADLPVSQFQKKEYNLIIESTAGYRKEGYINPIVTEQKVTKVLKKETKDPNYLGGGRWLLSSSRSATRHYPSPDKQVTAKDLKNLVALAKKYVGNMENALKREENDFSKMVEYLEDKIKQMNKTGKIGNYFSKDGQLQNCFPQTQLPKCDILAYIKMGQDRKYSFAENIYLEFNKLIEDRELLSLKKLKSNLKLLQDFKKETDNYVKFFKNLFAEEMYLVKLDELYNDIKDVDNALNKVTGRNITVNNSKVFSVLVHEEKQYRTETIKRNGKVQKILIPDGNKKLDEPINVTFSYDKKGAAKDVVSVNIIDAIKRLGQVHQDYSLLENSAVQYQLLYTNYIELSSIVAKYINVIATIIKERERVIEEWRKFLHGPYANNLNDVNDLKNKVENIKDAARDFIDVLRDLNAVNFMPNINNYNFDNTVKLNETDLNSVTNVFERFRRFYAQYKEIKTPLEEKVEKTREELQKVMRDTIQYTLQPDEIEEVMQGIQLDGSLPRNFPKFIKVLNDSLTPPEYSNSEFKQYATLYDRLVADSQKNSKPDPQLEQKLRKNVVDLLKAMFVAYEIENRSGFMRHVSEKYRSNLATGQNMPQLEQSILDDFRSLNNINFKLYIKGNPIYYSNQKKISVSTDWSRRATIRSSGDEWILENQSTTFTFRVNGVTNLKLVQMQGDTPFGLSAPHGDIVITEGKINLKTVSGTVVVSDGEISGGNIETDGSTPDITIINSAWYFSTRSTGTYASGDLYYTTIGPPFIGIPDDSAKIKKLTQYSSLEDVHSVPTSGYVGFYSNPAVGDIYAVISRSTGKYTVIQIKSIGATYMRFNYKIPVNTD